MSLELAPITLTVTDDVVAGTGQPPAALRGVDARRSRCRTCASAARTRRRWTCPTRPIRRGRAGRDGDGIGRRDRAAAASPASPRARRTAPTCSPAWARRRRGAQQRHGDAGAGVGRGRRAYARCRRGRSRCPAAVYRPGAAGAIAPVSAVVHVGDPGTFALPVANSRPGGRVLGGPCWPAWPRCPRSVAAVGGGTTGEIAPGAQRRLAAPGRVHRRARRGVRHGDGRADQRRRHGPGSIDGLGQVALGTVAVPVSVTVDSYAAPSLSAYGERPRPPSAEGVLDLGTLALGSAPPTDRAQRAQRRRGRPTCWRRRSCPRGAPGSRMRWAASRGWAPGSPARPGR